MRLCQSNKGGLLCNFYSNVGQFIAFSVFTLFQVLLIVTKGQRLDQFNILLSSAERKVLIGHLDIHHLEGVFLTRRQGLALQEEDYLRWVGGRVIMVLPFSVNFLQITWVSKGLIL